YFRSRGTREFLQMNHTTSRPDALAVRRRFAWRDGLLALVLLVAAVTGCTNGSPDVGSGPAPVDQIVILVSFDGFRWDYPDRGMSPNLAALAARGVRADGLIPSFPTKTFPNHYTLVTGLVPDHHGIVSNTMWDPDSEAWFSMSDRDEVQNGLWWEGEPVWVTAERHGLRTAPLFWPGSEAEIEGFAASHWLPFDGSMPNADRVQWILDLLDGPGDQRPSFLTLYCDETDIVGHNSGPDSEEMLAAIATVDSALGLLVDGLEDRGLLERTNIVVVSDHGMSPTSQERVMFVDDYVDLETARVVDWNPVLALWPDEENLADVYESLRDAHPHVSVYMKDSIPERFEYGSHPRVAPIIGIADDGWTITTHSYFENAPEGADGGNHGFDHQADDMRGIFIAAGPAFREGARVPAFRNVNVYLLVMKALGLPAVQGDGDLSEVDGILVQ
ncbi:MAG: alkaline phosphatase family protein, partial [Gemmatimonadetes bacterium]|nr:alkaline phosphatase family protein [Gemmatimonadota bacterium]